MDAQVASESWINDTFFLYPPDVATGSRLNLVLQYGANDATVDSALSRITRISYTSWRPNDANQTYDATFAYAGTSRRVASTRGNGVITQSTFDGGAYSGLDRFGRMRDLHFKNGSGATLQRFQYGYDLAGNRTYGRTTQFPAVEHDNDRSWLYTYDTLHRLVGASMGALNTTNTAMTPGGSGVPVPRTTTWALDNLGNWSADDELYHSVQTTGDFDGDGQLDADSRFRHHNVNSANEINQVVVNGTGITGAPDVVNVVHDPAGNLVFDGKYVYLYDAWNRLLSVNFAGSMAIPSGGPDSGRITDASQLGAVVCWFSYDGLGRLLCKSTPVNEGVTGMQSKSMYYDGVRRIAEVISRPPPIQQSGGLIQGGAQNNENPLALEGEDPPPQQIIQPPPDPIPVPGVDFWTDRQYIYGPEYVDEFLWQVPTSDMPAAYMLQDGNYNVLALVDAAGAVLTQQTFEPYGTIATFEKFENHAVNRVGHQALFFERFDGTYADPTLSTESDGFYYNRNRFYDPVNGRFTSRDPNETGIPILTAMAMNGDALSTLLGAFKAEGLYVNGVHVYQYESGNPVNRTDASGLFSLPEINISTAINASLFAINAYSTINDGLNYFKMFRQGMQLQQILASMAMDAAFSWAGGKAFEFAFDRIKTIANAYGKGPKDIALVVLQQAGCFGAGTEVLMDDGTWRTIETIREGDRVACKLNPTESDCIETGIVSNVSCLIANVYYELRFKSDCGITTILATPDHPFFVTGLSQYVPASELPEHCAIQGEAANAICLISKVRVDSHLAVYNFTVRGPHNYIVGYSACDLRLLVHNNNFPCGSKLAEALRRNARIFNTEDWYYNVVLPRLIKYHGATEDAVSAAIHKFKKEAGMGGADNLYLDLTGNVYHPFTGELMGRLIP